MIPDQWPREATPALPCASLVRGLALFGILTLLATACSNDADSVVSSASGSDATVPTRVASPAPEPTSTPEATPTPAPPNVTSLSVLDSYRFEIIIRGEGGSLGEVQIPELGADPSSGSAFEYTLSGAWKSPASAQVVRTVAGLEVKQTVIEGEQWITTAGVTEGPTLVDPVEAESLALAPSLMDETNVADVIDNLTCGALTNVNGIIAVPCESDYTHEDETFSRFAGLLESSGVQTVEAFSMKVWIAKFGGYVVRWELEMDGEGTDGEPFALTMHLNITDINGVEEISP